MLLILSLLNAVMFAATTYTFRNENEGKGMWEPLCGVKVDGNNSYHLFLMALFGAISAGSWMALALISAAMLLTHTGAIKDYNLVIAYDKVKAFFTKK